MRGQWRGGRRTGSSWPTWVTLRFRDGEACEPPGPRGGGLRRAGGFTNRVGARALVGGSGFPPKSSAGAGGACGGRIGGARGGSQTRRQRVWAGEGRILGTAGRGVKGAG